MAQKSDWVNNLEYQIARWLVTKIQKAPENKAIQLVQTVFQILLLILPKRKRLIHQQLKQAFPDQTDGDRKQIATQSIRTLAKSTVLFFKSEHWTENDFEKNVTIEGVHHIEKALKQGKGVICFTAHYGCWEVMALTISRLYPLAVVARPLDNPKLNRMIHQLRTKRGGEVIPRRDLLKKGLKHLRQNKILGILIDQNFSPGGTFVDFFGKLAATTPIVPILAQRTESVVLPIHNYWGDDHRLHIRFDGPVELNHSSDKEAIDQDTLKLTKIIEKWVRQRPEYWLWMHNRWKRRPQQEHTGFPTEK